MTGLSATDMALLSTHRQLELLSLDSFPSRATAIHQVENEWSKYKSAELHTTIFTKKNTKVQTIC